MKQYKIYLYFLASLMFMLVSCQDDESLNLRTYGDNHPSIAIEGAEKEKNLVVKAFYDGDGKIAFSDKVSRTFLVEFYPSPEEIKVFFEVNSKNLPEGAIEVDKEQMILPIGQSQAKVTVTLKDESLSFDKENLGEASFEIGVKAHAEGFKMSSEVVETKFTIQKEEFKSVCFLQGEEGSSPTFQRTYSKGVIINDAPIVYPFKVHLDKPALEDLKVKLTFSGLDPKFAHTMSIPEEAIITKGNKTSDLLEWKISNEFLLENNKSKKFNFEIQMEFEETDFVSSKENGAVVQLVVQKDARDFFFEPKVDPSWISIAKTNWGIEVPSNRWTDPKILIDGKGGPESANVEVYGSKYDFIIDMGEEQEIKGVGIDYAKPSQYDGSAVPANVRILTSLDNVTWVDHGIMSTPDVLNHYLKFYAPTNARYVKYEGTNGYGYTKKITEAYIYK